MDEVLNSGTPRRELFKGAAGLAVGAAAATVLTGGQVVSAAGSTNPMSMTIDDIGTFEVLAYSWGASQSGSFHSGGGGAGRPNFQDISITKYVDPTSPVLLGRVATGTAIPRATLTISNSKAVTFAQYRLTKILVTSSSMGGSTGEERLTENITLNFGKFEYSVGAVTFGFNIEDSV